MWCLEIACFVPQTVQNSRNSIYNNIKQGKGAKPHIWEAFCLINYQNYCWLLSVNQLVDLLIVSALHICFLFYFITLYFLLLFQHLLLCETVCLVCMSSIFQLYTSFSVCWYDCCVCVCVCRSPHCTCSHKNSVLSRSACMLTLCVCVCVWRQWSNKSW